MGKDQRSRIRFYEVLGLPVLIVCCVLFFLSVPGFVRAQPQRLRHDVAISEEIRSGQRLYFDVVVPREGYCEIEVRQQPGIDLAIAVYDPLKKPILKVGSQHAALRIEKAFSLRSWLETIPLLFASDHGGTYRVELDSRSSEISGSFSITLKSTGSISAVLQKRIDAARHFENGEQIRLVAREPIDLDRAQLSYLRALDTFREIGNIRGEVESLIALGIGYSSLKTYDKAAETFENAYLKAASAGEILLSAAAVCYLGGTYQESGHHEKAVMQFERALRIARESHNRKLEGVVLGRYAHALGKLANTGEEHRNVIYLIEESVRMLHESATPSEEAFALYGLATYFTFIGETQKSIETYQRGLNLLRPLKFRSLIVFGLLRIGELYFDSGDYQRAYDLYGEAYEYSRGHSDYYEAYTLYNLGNSTLTLDKRKVFEYLTRALPMWGDNLNGEAYTLASLGRFYFTGDDKRKALETYKKAVLKMKESGDMYGVGIILSLIGETHFALGEMQRALEFFGQALDLHRITKNRRDEAGTLIKVGSVHESAGDVGKALVCYSNALEIFADIGNRNGEAKARYMLAKTERKNGNISAARSQIEQTIRIVESLRAGIAESELRSAYFSSVQQYYELYVEILMSLHDERPDAGFDLRALEAAERGKARSLLELLASSQVDLREGIDKSLLDRERELQNRLDEKAIAQLRLVTGKSSDGEAAKIRNEIDDLTDQLGAVRGRINRANPRFAALSHTATLSAIEIQSLLDADTLLLEYKLGQERSFLWLVAPEGIKSFVLPKRAELETAAREVYEQLTVRNSVRKGETERQTLARNKRADERLRESSQYLSRLLLYPAADLLGGKRLVIVSDGALQYIPFGVLPTPQVSSGTSPSVEPMLVSHEIINLPSASTLSVMRQGIAQPRSSTRGVAVLADPVFSSKDTRVGRERNGGYKVNRSPGESVFSTQRALVDFGLSTEAGIPRLPFSRLEAEMIAGLLPGSSSLKALDFEASRATATSPELSKYGIVHFATHGLLNSTHPELSGLLFSLVDDRGRPQNGFLPLHEIYRMKLNAELVVLSACQTGLGKEISGEGLVGLTRGFMHAGSPRVVASLWKVDDAATAELMAHFYKAMIKEKQTPAAALRAAQLSMLKQRNWRQPYYWAAFTIQGEWR